MIIEGLVSPDMLSDSPAPVVADTRVLPSAEELAHSKSRRSTVFVFTDVTETSDNRFYKTLGPSPNKLIPRINYPGGAPYLGYLINGLSIEPSVQEENTPLGNSPLDHRMQNNKEQLVINTQLAFNAERIVDRYCRVLPGPFNNMSDYGGGARDDNSDYHNLLLIMINHNRWHYPGIKKYIESWLFFRGKFAATARQYGGWRQPSDNAIQMSFRVLAAKDLGDDSCLRMEGMQAYHHWYEDVETGELCDPTTSDYGGNIWPSII